MPTELETVCKNLQIKCESMPGEPNPEWPESDPWVCRLSFEGRAIVVPFYTGKGRRKPRVGTISPALPVPPTAADVLYCLASDARALDLTFEEFASEFGYDTDSRKAERAWRQCRELGVKVRMLLGDVFEVVANAEH